mgnify:CR=1 FL=1
MTLRLLLTISSIFCIFSFFSNSFALQDDKNLDKKAKIEPETKISQSSQQKSSQQDNENEINKFDTVVVTATKTSQEIFNLPMSTFAISKDEPQHSNAQHQSDLFRMSNGVEFTGGPARNSQEPRMRGYGSENIIMLLDGTRQNFNSGHSGRLFIEPELLKSVEVVRGSNSSLYGNGGLGGVMSFTTKKASDLLKKGQKLGAMQKNTYSSANNEFLNSTSIYGKSGKFDIVSNISYRNSGDIKLGNGDVIKNASNLIWSGLINTNYALSPYSTITANFNGSNNRSQELNSPQLASNDSDAFLTDKTIQTHTAKLGYKYKPMNDLIDFSISAYNTKTDISYIARQKTSTIAVGQTRQRSLNTFGLDTQNTMLFKSLDGALTQKVTAGINYFRDQQQSYNISTNNWSIAPQGSDENIGVFLQDELKSITKIGTFLFTPSMRYDMYQSSTSTYSGLLNSVGASKGDAFSPKLALSYNPVEWAMIYTNYGYGFRSPTVTERFSDGEHYRVGSWTNNFVQNPNLKAETNRTLEGGFGFDFKNKIQTSDRITFKNSMYRTEAFNFINQVQDISGLMEKIGYGYGKCNSYNPYNPACHGTSGTTMYINTNRALIQGFDSNLDYKSNNINLSLGYSMISAKDRDTNTTLYTSQPRALKTGISYKFNDLFNLSNIFAKTSKDLSSFVIGWRASFVGAFKYDTTNDVNELKSNFQTAKRPGYTVQDIYAQYNLGESLSFYLGVDNLTNKAYRRVNTANYDIGRSYRLGVTIKI